MNSLEALGGIVTRPVATLRRIAAESASPLPPLALLLVVTGLIQMKVLGRLGFLLGDGGDVIARRIRDAFVDPLKTDVAVLVGAAVVIGVLAKVLSKGRVSPGNAVLAAIWLTIPLTLTKAIGGTLQAFSVDLWWLPHHAVDSFAVLVDRKVSWARFAIKCATAYGPGLLLAIPLVVSFVKEGAAPAVPLSLPRRLVGLGVLGVAVIALAGSAGWSTMKLFDRIKPTLPGDPLPDATLRRLDEFGVQKEKVKLSMYQGQVLVLDFWASWCAPCRRSMPELSALHDELKTKGLVVLGVNREPQEPDAARKAMKEIAPTFDCVIDERGYGDKLGLTTLPTSYIVDRKGVVRHLHLGYVEASVLRGEIEALLAEP